MKRDDYVRAATVVRVVDGDSVICDVDLGFYVTVRYSIRFAGINARELNQPGGYEARENLRSLLPTGTAVTIRSVEADKFAGRAVALVYLDGQQINLRLLEEGWAAPYDGDGLASHNVPPWPREPDLTPKETWP